MNEPSYSLQDDPIAKVLRQRYSGHHYDSHRSVSDKHLTLLLEAARLAPSSCNEQPWAFIVCDRNCQTAAYEDAFETLIPFNQGWAKEAPILILAFARLYSTQTGRTNHYAQYDTGAAVLSLEIQATSLGLMTHQMGGFNRDQIREKFAVPSEYAPLCIITVGYPLPETKVKSRKPLAENFFKETWGHGYEQ